MALDQIVDVTITRENASVATTGFGIPLIVGNTKGTEVETARVKTYGSMDEVAIDFTVTDPEYLSAQKAYSGNVAPKELMIAYHDNTPSTPATSGFSTMELSGKTEAEWIAVIDGSYALNIDGVVQTATALDFSANVSYADIALTLEGAFTGVTFVLAGTALTVTSNTTGTTSSVVLTADATGTDLMTDGFLVATTEESGKNVTDEETLTEALDAISLIDDKWYALVLATSLDPLVQEGATYVQAKKKIFFARTKDPLVLDPASSSDIASTLLTGSFDRTALMYSQEEYIDSAWAGQYLPYDVGTLTFAHKSLSGIIADKLTTGEKTAVHDKLANTYTGVAGRNITQWGTTSTLGSFIDVIRTIDWLEARIQEGVYGRLVATLKIPYNASGFAIVAGEVEAVLKLAEDNGVINSGWTVTVPLLSDIPEQDKADRHFSGTKFTATLSGAVHSVSIKGVVL